MENEQIDPKEKKKLLDDLHTWLYFLDDLDDIDMIYQLTDMKTIGMTVWIGKILT